MTPLEQHLEQLRGAFGDDAERIYRGLAVAHREMELSDALEFVLRVDDAQRRGRELDGLEARVARAMNSEGEGDGAVDLDTGPLGVLAHDVATTMGTYSAGTHVRVMDRLSSGELLVCVLDLNDTVFPVPESALQPIASDAVTRGAGCVDAGWAETAECEEGTLQVARLSNPTHRLRSTRLTLEVGYLLDEGGYAVDIRYDSTTGNWFPPPPVGEEFIDIYNCGPEWSEDDWRQIGSFAARVGEQLGTSLVLQRRYAEPPEPLGDELE